MQLWITSIFTKILSKIITLFKMGSGSTLPGYILLKIFPNILKNFGNRYKKIILITGTNGKTTTTKIISHVLNFSGYKVLTNSSGSNLLRGIVTTALIDLDIFGNSKSDIAVFEVDEFSLESVLRCLNPNILLLLNLSRDQLDRYGEVDIILEKWIEAINQVNFDLSHLNLVCSINSTEFKQLRDLVKHEIPIRGFNIYPVSPESKIPLKGTHNELNLGAALAVLKLMGIREEDFLTSLQTFKYAFGRGEIINYSDLDFHLFLAKNPSSYMHNLQMLIDSPTNFDAVIFVLNDLIPDGHDVSWIYDINPEMLARFSNTLPIYFSGTRALDMAVRLHYCGVIVKNENINSNFSQIINIITEKGYRNVCVLPNYSAMLACRKLLTGRSVL